MVKKTSEQNPVDEAYLRSLMAGSPPERVTPSVPQKRGNGQGNGRRNKDGI